MLAVVEVGHTQLGEEEYCKDQINDREIYMKGIDHSYYYEGYVTYKTEEL